MTLLSTVKEHLNRFARFGANPADAHSCFIFVPEGLLTQELHNRPIAGADPLKNLTLLGVHSLSLNVDLNCRMPSEGGLIGWVSTHQRSIHVSPFELESKTLGVYKDEQELKSFIGIPIKLDQIYELRNLRARHGLYAGVLACDSKKCFAFSKLQGKLLEDLAKEISICLELLLQSNTVTNGDISWSDFIARCQALTSALGKASCEVLRIKNSNFTELELSMGTAAAFNLLEQFYRLIQQALPPHFPSFRLPNGDILVLIDNMMVSFYESKIRAMAEHLSQGNRQMEISFHRKAGQLRRGWTRGDVNSVEELFRETAYDPQSALRETAGKRIVGIR